MRQLERKTNKKKWINEDSSASHKEESFLREECTKGSSRATWISRRPEPAPSRRPFIDLLFQFLGRQSYTESVPQDLSIGREVMRVSATDIDDGNNSVVRYSISPKRLDDEIYFRIDRNTGVIFLNHTIDVSTYRSILSQLLIYNGIISLGAWLMWALCASNKQI